MRKVRVILAIVAVLCVSAALVPEAYAQATRTWVSGVGDDANPCSRTAPCRTFAGAISKTAAGGEISALDPGGFGAVTIAKSITINGEGTLAGILAASSNGVIVNAAATDKVIIRNISINGAGNGFNGIRYLGGAQLTVENVSIYGFQNSATSRCIDVALSSSGSAELIVLNTTMTNCANGVRLATSAGVLTALFDRVQITNMNSIGLEVGQGITLAMIKGSTISNNGTDGARVAVGLGTINIEDSAIAFNGGIGVNAAVSGARIRLSNNTIVNNATQISFAAGAFVQSPGNNRVEPAGTAPNATYTEQ
jgi:hypothetical protein